MDQIFAQGDVQCLYERRGRRRGNCQGRGSHGLSSCALGIEREITALAALYMSYEAIHRRAHAASLTLGNTALPNS